MAAANAPLVEPLLIGQFVAQKACAGGKLNAIALLLGLCLAVHWIDGGRNLTVGEPIAIQEATERELDDAEKTSSPFLFIKPHAVTDEVKALVKDQLQKAGISVLSEGTIPAEEIDKKQLIDTHYGAIASKAVKQKPADLTVQPKAQEDFQNAFGISWSDALQQDLVFNAMDGASKLGCTPEELGVKFDKLTKGVDMIKFGGGFYCGKVDGIFVINGFYMNMRSAFTAPGKSIHYYETEFPASQLSWANFRGKVLGPTDPKTAPEGSLRNLICRDWQKLGLLAEPNTGDNGVHASASPFEALAERANWLGRPIDKDGFGKALCFGKKIPEEVIKEWMGDPTVNFEGKKQSLFDLLEDTDGHDTIKKIMQIHAENKS